MILLPLLLNACLRLDCTPGGRILWGASMPPLTGQPKLIDGAMAAVNCTWSLDGHR